MSAANAPSAAPLRPVNLSFTALLFVERVRRGRATAKSLRGFAIRGRGCHGETASDRDGRVAEPGVLVVAGGARTATENRNSSTAVLEHNCCRRWHCSSKGITR